MKLVILLETVKISGKRLQPLTEIELEDSLADNLCASKVARLVVAGEDDHDQANLGSASFPSKELEGNSPSANEVNTENAEEGEHEEEDSSGEGSNVEGAENGAEEVGSLDVVKNESIEELKEVKGVGSDTAELLYSNGIKSIADLQTKKVADLKKLGIAEKQAQTIFNDAKNFA